MDSVAVDVLGLCHDRRWGLVDNTTGNVLTARREPRLLMAKCHMSGASPVVVTSNGDELRTNTDYASWLNRPVTLAAAGSLRGEAKFENPMDWENETDWVSWQGPVGAWQDSDRSRISILSKASLGSWDVRRFRANIVVDGSDEENLVGRLVRIGEVHLRVSHPIPRCVMVTRPQPGLNRDLDVLRTINRDHGSTLSVGATVETEGVISVGNTLEPIA